MARWVEFDYVKTQVSIKDVLGHYGLAQAGKERKTKRGVELKLHCPFHEDKTPSLSVHVETGRFHCFGCHAKGGDMFDFVVVKEGITTEDRNHNRRQAALLLQEWFGIASPGSDASPATQEPPVVEVKASPGEPAKEKGGVADLVINPPLGFELKRIDAEAGQRYAEARGISKEIAEQFGLAVALVGGYKGRLVIPLHNHEGVLVGYAARALDESEPKYLFPSSEKGFRKSYLVYNLWRVVADQPRSVVVTEGFFDVLALTQAGFPAVALMGSSLSDVQAKLLCAHFRHLVIMMDGDAAGRAATEECLSMLGRRRYVRAVELPDGQQPDQLSSAELREVLRYG